MGESPDSPSDQGKREISAVFRRIQKSSKGERVQNLVLIALAAGSLIVPSVSARVPHRQTNRGTSAWPAGS